MKEREGKEDDIPSFARGEAPLEGRLAQCQSPARSRIADQVSRGD